MLLVFGILGTGASIYNMIVSSVVSEHVFTLIACLFLVLVSFNGKMLQDENTFNKFLRKRSNNI